MFGTLKPHLRVLQDDVRATYNQYYCGLCKGLGDHYGQLTRGLLSQDAVFMALLADALTEVPAESSSCRCPLLPVVQRLTVEPGSVAMRYASAVQVLLGDQLLADRAMDGRRAHATARRWIVGHVAVARGMLAELGLDTAALEGFEHRQARTERDGISPDEAAAPTAEALAHVFRSLAGLPGMPEGARTTEVRDALGELGASVGRAIYLRDALEDLRDDLLGGAFNPCLVTDTSGAREISPARVEEAARSLAREVDGFGRHLDALPLARHGVILRNIVCVEFASKTRAAIERARRDADAVVRALWASAARRPRWDRALVGVALALMAAWAWVLRTAVAFAQPRRDAGLRHGHGHGRADAGLPSLDAGSPELDAGEYVAPPTATRPPWEVPTPSETQAPEPPRSGSHDVCCCGHDEQSKGCGDQCNCCHTAVPSCPEYSCGDWCPCNWCHLPACG